MNTPEGPVLPDTPFADSKVGDLFTRDQMLAMYAQGKAEGEEGEPFGYVVSWDTEDGRTRHPMLGKVDLRCFPANATVEPLYTRPAKAVVVTEEMAIAAEDKFYELSPANGPEELREILRAALNAALAGSKP